MLNRITLQLHALNLGSLNTPAQPDMAHGVKPLLHLAPHHSIQLPQSNTKTEALPKPGLKKVRLLITRQPDMLLDIVYLLL